MKNQTTELTPELPFIDEQGRFRFHPVSSDARVAIELKPLPNELTEWLEQFQTVCVLECCGINALGFETGNRWSEQWNYNARITKLLQNLRDEIASAPGEVLYIEVFQYILYKDDLLFLIDYLQQDCHLELRNIKVRCKYLQTQVATFALCARRFSAPYEGRARGALWARAVVRITEGVKNIARVAPTLSLLQRKSVAKES